MSRIESTTKHVVTALVAVLAMTVGLVGAGSAGAAAGDGSKVVGKSDAGKITSKVVGRTDAGDKVRGTFTPVKVVERDGQVWVKGFLEGVVVKEAGKNVRFSGIKKMPVEKVNGGALADGQQLNRAACDILNLVLGPLDLNLLGLEIHLKRVVLDVVAVAGARNLLGNLLCSVAGLLDGGGLLSGLLGQLTTLLNQILGALNLGV